MQGRLAFFGLPLGALTLLRDGHELAFAVLSPVPHVGRRRLLQQLGPKRVIEVGENTPEFEASVRQQFEQTPVELIVSWFWTRNIPEAWVRKAPLGAIGVHPSLLPRHRGPNPFFWAIDAGDAITGVTAHQLTPEYDTGPILLQSEVVVGERNAWQLARALDRPSLKLLSQATLGTLQHTLLGHVQEESLASLAPEPTARELGVDWAWSTERVLRRIRALAPTPGLALELQGHAFFVTRASRVDRPKLELRAGEAVVWGEPPTAILATVDGAIRLDECVLGEAEGDRAGQVLRASELARFVGVS